MGVSTYTPTGISHATSVDFSKRTINQPVHVVQYDDTLPILAVSLYNNGQLYRLPEDAEIKIRLGKPDKTFVYNSTLGCNADRTIVYFEITQQMTVIHGEYYPVIEIIQGTKIACSSSIYIIVDKNPIQHDYIESTVEYKEIVEYRNEALESSKNAATSQRNAKISEDNAKASETNAKTSELNAKESEDNSEEYSNLSKSYAIGTENTVRDNDENDNAKYYCNVSKMESKKSKTYSENAEKCMNEINKKLDSEFINMKGATADEDGERGFVPAPKAGDEKKALLGDGTWGTVDAIYTFKTEEEYNQAVTNDEIPDGAKVIKEYDEQPDIGIINRWNQISSVTGTDSSVAIDVTKYNEFNIIVNYDNHKFNFNVPSILLSSSDEHIFYNGYYASDTDNCSVSIGVSNTNICLKYLKLNTSDISSLTTLTVYGKI